MSNSTEIHELLGKLQELVPYMPKDKKLTKLEIIQNVIEYIWDLQDALEAHTDVQGLNKENHKKEIMSLLEPACRLG